MLRSPRLFSVEDAIASHVLRNDYNSKDASEFDEFERDYIEMPRLKVES
jgi:hypothetical protein